MRRSSISDGHDGDAVDLALQHAGDAGFHALGIVVGVSDEDLAPMLDGDVLEGLYELREVGLVISEMMRPYMLLRPEPRLRVIKEFMVPAFCSAWRVGSEKRPATLSRMEIHAPEGSVHSIKDFLVHISIVTVGILIALGLDGLREAVHNHRLIRETRETVHTEMDHNADHIKLECSRVGNYSQVLKALVATMPALMQQHPEQLAAQLNVDSNPSYFLVANSWEAALSTGVLAHMSATEVADYAYAAQAIRGYSALQLDVRPMEARAKAFIAAHPQPTPDQVQQEMENLILFARAEGELAFVCPQTQENIDRALHRAAAK